jgi:chromosome segregation ATPase
MARSFLAACVAATFIVGGFALVRVRGEQAPPQDSAALLNEVRLLRQAIEALAGSGARVQIVFGRLQLQEQRITAAVRRLDDVRTALAAFTKSGAEASERVAELEETLAAGRASKEQERDLQRMKRELARLEAERVRLAADESEAAALVAHEQGRWSDVNRQLEDLERALLPRPR